MFEVNFFPNKSRAFERTLLIKKIPTGSIFLLVTNTDESTLMNTSLAGYFV